MNSLRIGGQRFTYFVGYSEVLIFGPGLTTMRVKCADLKQLRPIEYERWMWAAPKTAQITNEEVAAYLQRQDVAAIAKKLEMAS